MKKILILLLIGLFFCNMYSLKFDKEYIYAKETIIEDNGGVTYISEKEEIDFSNLANTNEGMFVAKDVYGDSYYYRGAVENNWVYFGGFYWRIIRVNGDGTVRLIYSGTVAPDETEKVGILGYDVEIANDKFNYEEQLAEYVGYIYELGEQKGFSESSKIKDTLENWYEENLLDYSKYIADSYFCYDRDISSQTGYVGWGIMTGDGIGTDGTYFKAVDRLSASGEEFFSGGTGPSLLCDKSNSYTVSDTDYSKGALTYPIGLISADEVVMAGLVSGEDNDNNYLYSGLSFWTGTPFGFYERTKNADIFIVFSSGELSCYYSIYSYGGVRPVISLNNDIIFSGSGLYNDPYSIAI